MPTTQTSQQVLDRHFLEIRCGLLDLAAAFDRIERSDGFSEVASDPRLAKIHEAVQLLGLASGVDRAERLQLLFSDEYVPGWKSI